MNLPLPDETRNYFGNDKNRMLKVSNLGLLFNKYVSSWSDDWATEEKRGKDKVNLKAEFLNKIEKESFYIKQSKDAVESLYKRQLSMIQSLKSSGWHVESFNAITDSRLIIGLGGTSVIETGITLHPLYGFPYIPASGLKGLARAYAEIVVEPKPSGEELKEIFGSEDKDPHKASENRQGKAFFMDGLPMQFPELELDIMNPHYSDYYQGKKDSKENPIPPADYSNPVPVTFLAVAAEQKFLFAVYSRNRDLADKAKAWLIGGLTELGAGAKTNVGYGYFKMIDLQQTSGTTESTSQPIKTVDLQKGVSLTVKLKLVKNPQTFSDFVKQLSADDIEALRLISFKDMKSAINIGLVPTLESLEISQEIKQIIAQKMLEICNKPDEKYKEKLEKYKRLFIMAGKDI